MVMFSELSVHGPRQKPETLAGPTENALCVMAKETGLWMIPGSLFEAVILPDGSSVTYNTASVINPQGEVIRRYRKMFPFRPYEHDVLGGSEFCVFDVPNVGRFGVSAFRRFGVSAFRRFGVSAFRSATTNGFPRPRVPWWPWEPK
jgi:predicted amidohydrolase